MTQNNIPKHLKTILNEPKRPKIKFKITQNKSKQSRTHQTNSKTQIDQQKYPKQAL